MHCIYIFTPLLRCKNNLLPNYGSSNRSFPKINKNGNFSDSLQGKKQKNIDPRHSMYGIFTYIYPQNYPNVGIYIYHTLSIWEQMLVYTLKKSFRPFLDLPTKPFFLMSTNTISTESPGAAKGT